MRRNMTMIGLVVVCAAGVFAAGCQGNFLGIRRAETPTETATKTPTEAPTEAPTETPTKTPTKAPTETLAKTPAKAPAGWKLAYEADFSKAAAANEWVKIGADVKVGKGSLVVTPAGSEEMQIMLKAPKFPGSVRVEFTGCLTGDAISDLTCILNGDESGYTNAYILQFAGRGNTLSRLLVADNPVDGTVNEKGVAKAGKKHSVVAENDGGKITLTVDGKKMFEHTDANPLKGAGQDMIGFYVWDCTMTLEKLVVYTKPDKKPAK